MFDTAEEYSKGKSEEEMYVNLIILHGVILRADQLCFVLQGACHQRTGISQVRPCHHYKDLLGRSAWTQRWRTVAETVSLLHESRLLRY